MPTDTNTADDKLWAALHAHPDSTAGKLSTAAKIARSTAAKVLKRWADDGTVTRTSGTMDGGRRTAGTWAIAHTDDTDTEDTADHLDTHGGDIATSDDVADSANIAADVGSDMSTKDEPTGTANGVAVPDMAARLAPGALRDMVAVFLTEHAGQEFGPTAIGNALNRSSGAVNNALEKLVATGHAIKTNETPKRFTAANVDG